MEKKQYSQLEAQQRAEQIFAFQRELTELEVAGVALNSPEQSRQVQQYHQQLLQQLSKQHDIDVNSQSKQLTLGMKIASLFGALAMAASIFFLFYQFWGYLNTPVQVVVLITAPISLFLLSILLSQKDKSTYFAKIAALVSLCCFVLNLSMLGQIFNITPSPNAFAIWAAFAFLLAYACKARVLLFFAIVLISGFIAMRLGTWSGMYWISFGERPENFFIPSLLIFFTPHFISHRQFAGFDAIYRVTALIMIFLPILILSNYGQISYLTWSNEVIEGSYQFVGFVLSAAVIALGVKRHWNHVVQTGNVFFVLFLYTKLFDWWWDWMPKYIFFFIIGLIAILAILVFKRMRLHSLAGEKS